MSDTEPISEFLSLNRTQGARCGFQVTLAALNPEDRANLDEAMADPTRVQHTAIVRWLGRRNIEVDKGIIIRHRSIRGEPMGCKSCRT